MHRTFHVSTRFHPGYSLLGRGLRRVIGDARRAEAFYLVTLSLLALGLLLAQYFTWLWLQPAIIADPLGPVAVGFWLGQVGTLTLSLFVCLFGFTPAIELTITPRAVQLHRGAQERVLPYATITSVESISALLYHRHYARYAATGAYINRMTPQILILHTPEAPFALGLPPEDHTTVLHLLQDQLAPTYEAPIAQVA